MMKNILKTFEFILFVSKIFKKTVVKNFILIATFVFVADNIFSQTHNTVLSCHFANASGESKVYIHINGIKVDSTIAIDGAFNWRGNLNSVAKFGFSSESNIRFFSNIFIDTGVYHLKFDTISRFITNPLTDEKTSYLGYELLPNEKLLVNNEYYKLLDELSRLDNNLNLSIDSVYFMKRQLIVETIEKYHPKNAGVFLFGMSITNLSKLFTSEELKEYFSKADSFFQKSFSGKYIMEKLDVMSWMRIGNQMIDISAFTPDSQNLSLKDVKGKYILLDFWASWCKPCRAEHPLLRNLFEKYADKNFQIVSFSIDHDSEKWKDAIKKDSINWTQFSDLKGWKDENSIANRLGFLSVPQSVLINPDGIIIDYGLRGLLLENKLREIFE